MQVNKGVCLQRRPRALGLFAVLFVASFISGCIGLAGSSGKAKLTDSAPAESSVSPTSAAITWTTNLASSSQVVYGPTTAYGQSSPLDNTMVTSHSVTLANLTTGVQYHYKCQSQAADGSTSTTPDQTFTAGASGDTTPPAVAIISPINGATVSGTVTMAADATDNVAVANVRFQLDGNNFGAPITAAPYSLPWDTTSSTNGNHTVAAVATDTSGNSATSAVESITVSNAQSSPPPAGPTVSITSPANNSTVNGTVTVSAAASDSTGITSVQLQVDGANVGAALTTAPYNFSWNTTSVSNASHTLKAVATDTGGNSATSAAVNVTVNNHDTTPPTVSITSPANNATVSGVVTVNATASDNVAVASVQLQVDGANVGAADTSSPYTFSWSSNSVANGSHTLTAVAKDASGNKTTSAGVKVTVSNNSESTPPTVSITSPANNATVSGAVTVSAAASDSAGVASVQLQVDGANVGAADTSSPYTFSWSSTSVSNGSHTLTAVAKDSSGNKTTSAGVKVTVSNSTDTTPPAVSITSPANSATVSGTVTVTASASDNVGVASVQFQVDGNNAGSADTSSPYNFSWNTASYANGSHALAAIAKDAAGNSAVSATVNVTVSNASSGGGSGSGIPSTLGWFDVAGQQVAPNCPPDPSSTGSCYGVVDAWNSGIADTNRNILWVWGGGHNDYSGNEIYAFNLNTLKLTRANNPADPTPTCTPAFSNGTPSSRHTYGGTVYMPNVDKMLVFGGVPYCPSGGFISDTWTLDMSQVGSSGSGGWTQLNPTISGNGGVAPDNQFGNAQLQYDPNTQTAILNESTYGLWSYNATTNTYTHLGSAPSSLSLHQGTVIDPLHKLFLRFGDNHAESISIAPGSDYSVTTLNAAGCSGLEGNNPGLQWDPVLQLVVGWPNFGGTVYLYNPVSDSCTTQTYSASAPPDSDMTGTPSTTNGTFKRFGYFPALGVYALVNEWNIDAHTLRLTAGSGSGGSSSTTISNVTASNITTNSATISWTTSAAATTQVMYGTTSSLGSLTTKITTMATSHSQTLTGLSADTLYFFEAQSVDGSGNTVTSSVLSFGTTNTTDTTPPTVSMTAPANGSSVSGTVTVSANASDNVAVANVQFLLDGANLGSADAASPYSVSWDTTTASNGSHTLSATATDTSGNSTTATAVTVTVSNSSGSGGDTSANADFQARCAAAGVIRCVSFDTAASVSGNAAPGLPLITGGLTTPTVDTTVFASGGGSLHFAVPAGATSPNTSGSFDIDFSDDFSQQIDSLINGDPLSKTTACGGSPCKNEIWIQWRQRFDGGMLQKFANSNGWKQVILGEGDTASTLSYSCSDLETVVENSNQFEIPRMYHSCGVKLDEYDPLEVNTGRTDSNGNGLFSPQNAAGGYLNCTYTVTIDIPTIPPCVPYVTNQWMTFQLHIQVGTWYPGGVNSSGGPPAPFKHDSTIQLYVAQEGQPSQLVMDMHPGATSAACDASQQDIPSCQTGYDLVNPTAYGLPDGNGNMIREKFGKIWLLPYQTNLDCPSCAAANTWYDELIISYQQVADPKF